MKKEEEATYSISEKRLCIVYQVYSSVPVTFKGLLKIM